MFGEVLYPNRTLKSLRQEVETWYVPVEPEINIVYTIASLALPFFGYSPVRTPCIWEETAYREAN